jgi:hypothetical protein
MIPAAILIFGCTIAAVFGFIWLVGYVKSLGARIDVQDTKINKMREFIEDVIVGHPDYARLKGALARMMEKEN